MQYCSGLLPLHRPSKTGPIRNRRHLRCALRHCPVKRNRSHLQAGDPYRRHLCLPLLDARHDTDPPRRRQPAPPPQVGSLPRSRPPQARAYERHIQISLIVQGLLQYLALFHPRAVWRFFGSWLRTTNRAAAPSELVVAHAQRNSIPDFLLSLPLTDSLKIFLAPKLAPERCPNLESDRFAGRQLVTLTGYAERSGVWPGPSGGPG